MYRIIHFTVAESDYELPPKVQDILISNPDVEHHDAYASFDIDGKMVDCYVAVIASKPFEKAGDSFIQVLEVILIPVDSSDTYYPISEAKNYWEVFGDNTGYAIDPEECMADNFSYAMTYGVEGKDYKTPEIITAILDYVR